MNERMSNSPFVSFLQSDTQWVVPVFCALLENDVASTRQNPAVTLAPPTNLWVAGSCRSLLELQGKSRKFRYTKDSLGLVSPSLVSLA